jgi:hypothetical protein
MHKERARQRQVQGLIRSIWIAAGAAVAATAVLIALSPRALPTVAVPTSVPRPYDPDPNDREMGAAGAPVLFEEFSDFQ